MKLRRPASLLLSLLAFPIALGLAGCSSLETISITPASGAVTLSTIGQSVQFTALGTSRMGSAQATTSNITTEVTWASSNTSVATINAAGLATAVGVGHSIISAESGGKIATSDITVVAGGGIGSGSGTPYINIIPGSVTDSFVGETTQFIASGNLTGGAAQNLTTSVQWISSNVQVATITAAGLATAVGSGTTSITALSGGTTASGNLTVTLNGTSSSATLQIIPTSATATFAGETTQFIVLGNLGGATTIQNLTNAVSWSSSDVAVATIDKNGLATAVGANTSPVSTTITAIGTTNTGSLISATALLTASPTGVGVTLPALSVYMTGTGTGTVTSSPGTVACGSPAAGASCTGTFTLNSTITLTALPATGSSFAGWSSNCTVVVGNPLQCTIKMSNNQTVGAIFN